jgi:hypothetical protein
LAIISSGNATACRHALARGGFCREIFLAVGDASAVERVSFGFIDDEAALEK